MTIDFRIQYFVCLAVIQHKILQMLQRCWVKTQPINNKNGFFMTGKVYINRLLNMRRIKYIGLDMDHTLVRYHSEEFESLVFNMVIERLIASLSYPPELRRFRFDYKRAIRGLVIDSKNGNIIKLSRYAAIRMSAHGTRLINYEEQKKIYYSVYVDLSNPNYVPVDTTFSISYCLLYALLIDLKDQHPETMPSYQQISDDVRNTVDVIHADGSLKAEVAKDLSRFVIQDRELVKGLKRYIEQGKKFFVLTNSDYHYTRLLLDFALTPFLNKDEHWLDLFSYVIVLSGKPRFFFDNHKFLSVDPKTGLMSNIYGTMTEGVYQGGNATRFTQQLKVSGDEILYIGDHIYGDIVRLKKDCNWRTAMVIEELGAEVSAIKATRPIEQKINKLMQEKESLEKSLLECMDDKHSKKAQDLLRQITNLDSRLSELIQKMESAFNPIWGQLFRTGAEESFFASQVERFACIYMEKLGDLLQLSPMSYFRAHRRYLPHEQDSML